MELPMQDSWAIISEISEPRLKVTPSKAMVDDLVRIQVTDLRPSQCVTIVAQLQENKARRIAYAHLVSNARGQVDTETDASMGGTYSGRDGMGLFWSMIEPSDHTPPHCRLMIRDVNTPFVVHLAVLDEFQAISAWDEYKKYTVLCETDIERWYLSRDTAQEVVRHGRLRGLLFYPKNGTKHPGVIDLFGAAGGLLTFRAALLASHGYATFALAYFNYEDLPKDYYSLDYEYFDEAVQFLSNHPKFKGDAGLSVIGVLKGAEIAAHLASYNPAIRNCFVINGLPYYYDGQHSYRGRTFKPHKMDFSKMLHNGMLNFHDTCLQGLDDPELEQIPVHQSTANFLLIQSGDDLQTDRRLGEALAERVREGGRAESCRLCVYPGAGHLLEPPHTPLSRCIFFRARRVYADYGGDVYWHAKAQKQAWEEILQLLQQTYKTNEEARAPANLFLDQSRLETNKNNKIIYIII